MAVDNDRKKWLMMLYLSGDNNLSPEMVWAINELADSKVPEDFAITIQYDSLTPGSPTARYAIDEHTPMHSAVSAPIPFPEAVADALLEDDAASPAVLADFVRWSITRYPSEHRMLILSGHGAGTIGDFLTDDQARREGLQGSMTIDGIRLAIEYVRQPAPPSREQNGTETTPAIRLPLGEPVIHVLGLDSCLMSTLEIAAELSHPSLVQFLVASEGFVPNTGWPFGYLMKKLKERLAYSHDSLHPRSLCECLVEDCADYYASYLPAGVSFDIAACDLAGLEAVQPAVEKLTTVLNALPREAFEEITVLAHWRAQSFKWEQYTDLGDFCEQLRSYAVRVQMAQLQEACEAVIESIRYVITTHRTVGIEFQYARGLSVYFPWSVPAFESPSQLEIYGQLKFPNRSGWLNFLQHYVEATKRPPAEPDSHGRPVIEWPLRGVAAGQQRRLVARQLSAAFPSKVSPDLRTKVAPDLRTKVAPDLRTKVAPDLRTKMAGGVGVGVGSTKNPPQTVKLAVPLEELIATP